MGDSKIKIDLSQGLIEVEGNEEFVKFIYFDFKEKLHLPRKEKENNKEDKKNGKKETPQKFERPKKAKTHFPGPKLQIVKELDLSGANGKLSLRDFYDQYLPINFMEKNLIFCYYLEHEINIAPITVNHVFTCYRKLEIKAPTALYQSLKDTASRKGWLDTSSLENIKVPTAGTNYIEHDMKKANNKSED